MYVVFYGMQQLYIIIYNYNYIKSFLNSIAPTGSGKTLAYSLPMIPHIEASRDSALKARITRRAGPVAIVLVPTRELAIQVVMSCYLLYAGRYF